MRLYNFIILMILALIFISCQKSTNKELIQVQNVIEEKNIQTVDENTSYPNEDIQKNIMQKVFDSSFEIKSNDYWLEKGAVYDQVITKTGKQSINLSETNATLNIYNIPVKEGKWYIISGYMYVTALPADVIRLYTGYLSHGKHAGSVNYPMISISKTDTWQEFIMPLYIKKDLNITHAKVIIRNIGQPNTNRTETAKTLLDDLRVYEVKDTSQLRGQTPPSQKRTFEGSSVKVDNLGNFFIKDKGTYTSFVPLIIYPDSSKTSEWDKYREKGFNTVICNGLDQARKAVSLGMHWIWSMYDYGIYDGDEVAFQRFLSEYQQIKENEPAILEKLLYFYWDNETYQRFDTVKKFADTIKKIDVDQNGIRHRPFFMQLDFASGVNHYHNEAYQLMDLQGLYANAMIFEGTDIENYGVDFQGNYNGEFANFALFENVPGNTLPKSVFVINSPFGDQNLETTIMAAIARGGKGFAYWRDGGSQPAIETKKWWNGLGDITKKIQLLTPLIQTPHWTKWRVKCSLADDEDGMLVGTRELEDYRCMIAASRSDKSEVVSFEIPDYNETQIFDYFTSKVVTNTKEGKFELSFIPHGNGVYCWQK